jgi:hypothetical protein
MKICMQFGHPSVPYFVYKKPDNCDTRVPYAGSEFHSAEDTCRAQQAGPNTPIMEHTARLTLKKKDCQSAPKLINCKRSIQDELGFVPGGYIVYLVTENPPGIVLERFKFWDLSRGERDEIREAFRLAYV